MSVIIIGKHSFLASHLAEREESKAWGFLSHEEALARPNDLKSASVIVNCALHPDMHAQEYDADKDIDFAIATLIHKSECHYIMMSSRMVYGDAPADLVLSEEDETSPQTKYGQNKLRTERALQGILPAPRLTILRMSNIFGYEPDRPRFFGQMMSSLKQTKKIVFDIAPDSQRDFLSVWAWSEIVTQVIQSPQPGIFNVGAGFGVSPQDLAEQLIKKTGYGEVVYEDRKLDGQFILDVTKLQHTYSISPYTMLDLLSDVETVVERGIE